VSYQEVLAQGPGAVGYLHHEGTQHWLVQPVQVDHLPGQIGGRDDETGTPDIAREETSVPQRRQLPDLEAGIGPGHVLTGHGGLQLPVEEPVRRAVLVLTHGDKDVLVADDPKRHGPPHLALS
jgi:hypothetical protein